MVTQTTLRVNEVIRQQRKTKHVLEARKLDIWKKDCSIWQSEHRKQAPKIPRKTVKAAAGQSADDAWNGGLKALFATPDINSRTKSHMTSNLKFFIEIKLVKNQVFLVLYMKHQ